jgi:hypothetical protein
MRHALTILLLSASALCGQLTNATLDGVTNATLNGVLDNDAAATRTALGLGTAATAASGDFTAANTARPVINVIEYGATGDGITDDTAAFVAATAAAKAAKKPLYIPALSYLVSGIAITLDWEGAEVIGEGNPAFGTFTKITTTSNRLPVIMVPADYNSFKVEGIRVIGPSATLQTAVTGTATAATDVIAATAHGLTTGDMVMCTTTNTLPAPLSVERMYWAIRVDDDSFKLAYNRPRALLGTAIDITAVGSGTNQYRPTSCGMVVCGESLQSGAEGSGASVDFCEIDRCYFGTFNVGSHLEEFSNSSLRSTVFQGNFYGCIMIGNSTTIMASPAGSVAGTGTVGIWMAGGAGSSIISSDFAGPQDIGILHQKSGTTTIVGCNFETAGSRSIKSVTTDGRAFTCVGCYFGNFGTPGADTFSVEIGGEQATFLGCLFGVTSTTNGAAIKQNSTISRNLSIWNSSSVVKIDTYASGVYSATLTAANSMATANAASGEAASAATWGHMWRRVITGGNDVVNFGVRNAAGSFAWANLLEYHFDKAANGASAYTTSGNTFTGTPQTIENATNPSIRIRTGADSGQASRFVFALATSSFSGAVPGDSVILGKSGGSLGFGTETGTTAQTLRVKIKASGVLNSVTAPTTYADNAAALSGGLVAGDVYKTSTGQLMIVY